MSAGQETLDALKFWAVIAFTVIACVYVGRFVTEYSPALLLTGAIGAVAGLVTFMHPKVGLSIVVFSMILSPRVAGPGMAIIKANDLLLAVIVLAWLARTAVFRGTALFVKTPLNLPIIALSTVYIVATVLGLLRGTVLSPERAFFYVLKYVEYFLLYFMTVNVIDSHEDVRRYLKYGWITAIIATVYCYSQIGSGERLSLPFDTTLGDTYTGSEANTCGGYYLVVFGLLMSQFTQGIGTLPMVSIASFLFMLTPFLLTESRSSYGGFAMAMMFHLLLTRKRRLTLLFGVSAALMTAFMVPTIRDKVVSRVEYTFSGDSGENYNVGGAHITLEGSAAARIDNWHDIFTIFFPKHPLIGSGVSAVGLVDVYYPRVLGETGLIGLAVFLWLIYRIFSLGWKAFAAAERLDDKALSLGVLTVLSGLLVQSLAANTFIIVRIMEPFWFATALMARMYVDQEKLAGVEASSAA